MNRRLEKPLSYRDAGVDIERGNQLVRRIKSLALRTHRPEVVAGVGGFGALFEVPAQRFERPLLVSAADGVGTKLRLAVETGIHDTIGIDLVAMCANDILVLGAEPLFFLDYYATGRLELAVAEAVVQGIARGCELAGAALIGGECAEMPGIYAQDDYDLAGFCVGIVEHDAVIDGARVEPGNVLIGIASSGLHANGYSLVREVIARAGAALSDPFEGRTLGETLLAPTRIYAKPLRPLIDTGLVRAMAHITGGGLLENLPRVLPAGTAARIRADTWERPPVFDWVQRAGEVADQEMYRTFNCGVGLVVCVAAEAVEQALALLGRAGEEAWAIGAVEAAEQGPPVVHLR